MNRITNMMLLGLMTVGLGLCVTSCKDDDNDKSAEQQAAEQAEQSSKFWSVAGQLVGVEQATDDYANKTFAPTIGEAKDGSETVRQVLTNDLITAAIRFSDLAGLEDGVVNENTDSYTWSDPAVGTLVYTKTNDGQSLATVDVNIKQIPQLRQIVYLTAEQQGKNASFTGTAYYRFGDVISKPNADGQKEYWVCVRPAFSKENKGDSHWITVSPLPRKHIYTYGPASNGKTYELPKNLSVSDEHMNNLAEMLYAITHPVDWYNHVTDYSKDGIFGPSGLPIFHDFHVGNVKYHNQFFWQKVAAAWEKNDIAMKVFGITQNKIAEITQIGKLYFLAEGYSWPWGNSPTLYQYRYYNGTKNTELNMHKKEFTKVSKNVIANNIELNLKDYTLNTPYLKCPEFFGDEYGRFIVRHATGKELMGSQPDFYQSMNGVNGISEVYYYNKVYSIASGKEPKDPEIASEDAVNPQPDMGGLVGQVIGADGNFYLSKSLAEEKSGAAVAVVVAYNADGKPLEENTAYNGLAMSLLRTAPRAMNAADGYKNDCGLDKPNTFAKQMEALNGLHVTEKLSRGCGKDHEHPAVLLCYDFASKLTEAGKERHNYSHWFMPSYGQWLVALNSIGFQVPTSTKIDLNVYQANQLAVERFFTERGMDWSGEMGKPFWTCSLDPNHSDDEPTFIMGCYTITKVDEWSMVNSATYNNGYQSRPFILFEYK